MGGICLNYDLPGCKVVQTMPKTNGTLSAYNLKVLYKEKGTHAQLEADLIKRDNFSCRCNKNSRYEYRLSVNVGGTEAHERRIQSYLVQNNLPGV